MKPLLLTFTGTLLMGAITGWAASSAKKPVPLPGAAARHATSASQATAPPPVTAADLKKVFREADKDDDFGDSVYADAVAGLTTEEIRAALAESLTNKDFLLKAYGARSVAFALLAEWLKRDCHAAGEWFLSIDSAPLKEEMVMLLGSFWPTEQAEKGYAFLLAHPEVFNGHTGWSIILKTFESRAQGGPQAVVDLLRELRERKFDVRFGNTPRFPESFDFPALMNDPEVAALWDRDEGRPLVRAWHAQNRDAAFQWLLETKGAGSLAIVASSQKGDIPGNLQWLGSKYAALDPTQREEFREVIESGGVWTSARVTKLVAGTTDPAAADELRGMGVRFIFSGKTRDAIPLLAGIADPVRRLEILENATPQGSLAGQPHRWEFTPADEERLCKSLNEWNATEGQIESIITKFRP